MYPRLCCGKKSAKGGQGETSSCLGEGSFDRLPLKCPALLQERQHGRFGKAQARQMRPLSRKGDGHAAWQDPFAGDKWSKNFRKGTAFVENVKNESMKHMQSTCFFPLKL